MIGRERALEKALAPVRDDYDYILIDTPPSLGLLTINALVAADGVIVPVQCEYLSLRGLVQLENTLTMIRENLNPHVEILGILPTMYDSRTLHSREAVEILEENFGDLVFKTRIRKTIRYAEAPVKGTSVLEYDPTGERRRGVPRPGEGGAQWRESAPACVRARSRSSSARPRPRSAAGRARGERAAAPSRRAARRDGRARRRRSSRPDAGAEPPRPTRRARAAEPRARGRDRPRRRAGSSRCPSRRRASHRAPRAEPAAYLAVIRVVGVGGAGLNARQPHDRRRHLAGRVRRASTPTSSSSQMSRRADEDPHRPRAHRGPRLRRRPRDRPPRRRGGATTRSSARCAARTWCSSPPARAAAPAPAPRPSSRGSRASSARSRSASSRLPFRFEGTRRKRRRPTTGVEALREACDTRDRRSRTTACSRCSTSRRRCSTRSGSPTTSCARACRASAT